jgi:dipeptidyl aminopeptidase/acylaminoacyl peptidase
MIACRTNTFFKAAGALSGDFDQTLMPKDNLMSGVYGPFSLFSERWKTIDNPVSEYSQIKIPIYIGHGKSDKVVPYTQSELLYNRLLSLKNGKKYMLHTPEMGHDFLYWDSEVIPILDFFESIKE